MGTLHWLQTGLEVFLIATVIICIAYEPVLAKWEERQKEKVLKALKERKDLRK